MGEKRELEDTEVFRVALVLEAEGANSPATVLARDTGPAVVGALSNMSAPSGSGEPVDWR